MGTVALLGPGVDEYAVGDRVAVEIHAGCGQCRRCRSGMYKACTNYGRNYPGAEKGHRANGFTTNGGFAQYAINHINTWRECVTLFTEELPWLAGDDLERVMGRAVREWIGWA